jgi:hypothetical protein
MFSRKGKMMVIKWQEKITEATQILIFPFLIWFLSQREKKPNITKPNLKADFSA